MISPSRLPYPGLRAFTREESDLFFGRDGCVDAMVDRLAATRFLAVLGSSGSGKSSLVRTGLLDALDLGLHPWAGTRWKIADFHPGGQPIRNLASALLVAKDGATPDDAAVDLLAAFLRRGPRSIAEWASGGNLEQGCNLLLLVDQFEELFRYGNYARKEEAESFVALLLETTAVQGLNVHVVVTMRSEFLGASALMPGLAEKINAGLYLTPRMTRDECREAIEGPAGVLGFSVEPALVNRLLNDLGSFAPWEAEDSVDQAERLARRADQLPLMQHVLNRLWARAANEAGGSRLVLRLAEYDGLGGMSGAIDAHGREILSELGEARAGRVEAVFRSLVSGSGVGTAVRRPCRMEGLVEATGDRGDVIAIVEAFSAPDCNFLRTSETTLSDAVIVDISHESLIRQWTPLRSWLENEARAGAAWRRLVAAEERYSGGEGGLLTGLDLQNLAAWWESSSPTSSWAARHGGRFDAVQTYMAESRRTERLRVEAEEAQRLRERNRLRRFAAGLAAALAVFVGLGISDFISIHRFEVAQKKLDAESRQIAIERDRALKEAHRTAAILDDVSNTVEQYRGALGTSELESQLMGTLAPFEEEYSKEHPGLDAEMARDDNLRALSFETVGEAREALTSYAKAFQGSQKTIAGKLSQGQPLPDSLLTSFLNAGYRYAWFSFDIGEDAKGEEVLNAIRNFVSHHPPRDNNPQILIAYGRFENLESRYAFDHKQKDVERRHARAALDLAMRAEPLLASNADLASSSFVVTIYRNWAAGLTGPAAEKFTAKACDLADRMMTVNPLDSRSIGARSQCLEDEAWSAQRKGKTQGAEEKIRMAEETVDNGLRADPRNQGLLLSMAKLENVLVNLEWSDKSARFAHGAAAKEYIVRALSGRTLLGSSSGQIKELYDDCCGDWLGSDSFPNQTAELGFFKDIVDAVEPTLEAFPKAPSFAYVAAKASAEMADAAKAANSDAGRQRALSYLTKAIDWFDTSGAMKDLSTPSDNFAAYCGAFEQRAEIYAATNRANEMLADLRKMRTSCTPALEKYPWDFSLRMKFILGDEIAGKALVGAHRYGESVVFLNRASYWGDGSSSKLLADAFRKGLGVTADEKKADRLDALAKDQLFVSLTIHVGSDSGNDTSTFFAYEWPGEYTRKFPGINDQVRWYREVEGGTIDQKRVDAVQKLQQIANSNGDSFPGLCMIQDFIDPAARRYEELVSEKKQADADRLMKELVDAVDQLLMVSPGDGTNYYAWRVYFFKAGQLDETDKAAALRAYARSAELADLLPKDNADYLVSRVQSYYSLGYLDYDSGKFEDAQVSYAKAVEAAQTYFDLGASAQALKYLRLTSQGLLDSLAKLKRDGDAENVRRKLVASVSTLVERSRPDDALIESSQALDYLGDSAAEAGNQSTAQTYLARARDFAKRVTEDTPDSAYGRYLAFNQLGDAFLKNDRPADARESYAEASASAERYIGFRLESPAQVAKSDTADLYDLYGSLSYTDIEAGKFDKGIAAAEAGLKLKPDAEWIEANLAHGLLLSGKRDEAIQHYMHARKGNVNGQTVLEATKDDFEHLQKLGFNDPEMPSILIQMQQK